MGISLSGAVSRSCRNGGEMIFTVARQFVVALCGNGGAVRFESR